MKKSILKEIIQNIVVQKLEEAKGNPAKHGYIISGKGTDDPHLQLIGYGNMPASFWKKKIERDFKDMLSLIQRDDWHNAAYLLGKNSVLISAINMMDEIYSDKKLKEADVGSTDSASASNPTLNSASPADRSQGELDKYNKQLTDLTNGIKEIDAEVSKLQEPVKKKVTRLELEKSQLSKQQGPIIKKIDQLKAKLAAAKPSNTQSA